MAKSGTVTFSPGETSKAIAVSTVDDAFERPARHDCVPLIAGMLFLLGERRWYILAGCSVGPVVLLYVLSVHLMRIGVV
jgi:hypothetical protein